MPNVIRSTTCLLLGPSDISSDWNSSGNWQLTSSCVRFTWVATKPWSIAINPVKEIQRIPVVFRGEGHNLNLKDKDTSVERPCLRVNLRGFLHVCPKRHHFIALLHNGPDLINRFTWKYILTSHRTLQHSLGCRLPREQRSSRHSWDSLCTALGIRERGWCLCGESTRRRRELDGGRTVWKREKKLTGVNEIKPRQMI